MENISIYLKFCELLKYKWINKVLKFSPILWTIVIYFTLFKSKALSILTTFILMVCHHDSEMNMCHFWWKTNVILWVFTLNEKNHIKKHEQIENVSCIFFMGISLSNVEGLRIPC